MPQESLVDVRRLTEYWEADACQLGRLRHGLGPDEHETPITEDVLREIIDAPDRDLVVAVTESGRIVGTGTLHYMVSLTMSAAYLHDFITDPEYREQGVGSALWEEFRRLCEARNINRLDLTSGEDQQAAHRFYKGKGAFIRNESTIFRTEFTPETTR